MTHACITSSERDCKIRNSCQAFFKGLHSLGIGQTANLDGRQNLAVSLRSEKQVSNLTHAFLAFVVILGKMQQGVERSSERLQSIG